jgi:hypothetical protein
VKTKTALDATSLNVVEQTPYLDIESKPDKANPQADALQAKAVVLIDPSTGKSYGAATPLRIIITDAVSPLNNAAEISYPRLDGVSPYALNTINFQYLYNLTSASWDRARTPNVWKSALISANGSTAIWTSAVGKKWRLMGMMATLVNATTAAAASLLKMLDAAADTGIGVQICGAALGAVPTSTIIFNASWQNGYLAAATNTALNVNLSSVLAVAGVFVQVWGTEE